MTDPKLTHELVEHAEHAQTQYLPFRIRIAHSNDDIRRAVAVRTQAYGRHVPGMEEVLKDPEPDDDRDDAVLLIAESKEDGQVLGSMRAITNARYPLHLEHELALPAALRGRKLAEAWRLTVLNSEPARMVAPALYKSLYKMCVCSGVDYVLVAARPPVNRIYRAMQFKDALNGEKFALSNTLNIPHGLYYLPIREAFTLWETAKWPLYPFMALTHHPDIEIDFDVVCRRFQSLPAMNGGAIHRNLTI